MMFSTDHSKAVSPLQFKTIYAAEGLLEVKTYWAAGLKT